MSATELPKIFHLRFAPEQWSNLERLSNFVGLIYPKSRYAYDGLTACERHLEKVQVIKRIAERLLPDLPKDREELDRYGASRNLRSQEYAALWETMVSELYASLDGLRQFLFGIFSSVRGVQNASNEKLFKRAFNREYGPEFLEEIRQLLAQAYETWFPKLRKLRTELTHGQVGSCHADENGNIRYLNSGLGSGGRAFFLENADAVVREYESGITALLESITKIILAGLNEKPQFQICGVYLGRCYARVVAPSLNMTFADGHCISWDWFEKEKELFCPLASQCGAYARKWPGGSKEILGG